MCVFPNTKLALFPWKGFSTRIFFFGNMKIFINLKTICSGLRIGWNENQSPSQPTGAQSSPSKSSPSTGGGGGGADAPSYSLFSGSPWAGASLLSGTLK